MSRFKLVDDEKKPSRFKLVDAPRKSIGASRTWKPRILPTPEEYADEAVRWDLPGLTGRGISAASTALQKRFPQRESTIRAVERNISPIAQNIGMMVAPQLSLPTIGRFAGELGGTAWESPRAAGEMMATPALNLLDPRRPGGAATPEGAPVADVFNLALLGLGGFAGARAGMRGAGALRGVVEGKIGRPRSPLEARAKAAVAEQVQVMSKAKPVPEAGAIATKPVKEAPSINVNEWTSRPSTLRQIVAAPGRAVAAVRKAPTVLQSAARGIEDKLISDTIVLKRIDPTGRLYEGYKDLTRGHTTIATAILKDGLPMGRDAAGNLAFDTKYSFDKAIAPVRGKSVDVRIGGVLHQKGLPELVQDRLASLQADEMRAKGRALPEGFKNEGTVNEIYRQLDAPDRAAVDESTARFRAVLDGPMEIMFREGYIGEADWIDMKKEWAQYAPYNRVLTDTLASSGKGGVGFLKKRTKAGSELPLKSIFDSTIKNYVDAVAVARNNAARRTIVDMMIEKGYLEKGRPAEEPKVAEGELADIPAQQRAGMGISIRKLRTPPLRPNEIAVRRVNSETQRGFTEAIEVNDPALRKLLQRANPGDANVAASAMRWSAKTYHRGVTGTLKFVERNPFKDFFGSLYRDPTVKWYPWAGKNSIHAQAVIKAMNYPRLLGEIYKRGDMIKALEHEGQVGAMLMEQIAPDKISRAVQDMTRSKVKIIDFGKDVVTSPFEMIRKYLSAPGEMVNRLYHAERAYKRTGSEAEFRRVFRDIGVDFAEKGSMIQPVSQYAPFFSARIAGVRTELRAASADFPNYAMKGTVAMTVPLMLDWYFRLKDEDWYKEANPILKNAFWPITPTIWLPLPPGIGQVFGTMPVRVAEYWDSRDPEDLKSAMRSMAMASGFDELPTVPPFTTMWNQARNKTFFKTPIETRGMGELEVSQRFTERTAAAAFPISAAARKAGIKSASPVRTEQFLRDLFPGYSEYGFRATDVLAGKKQIYRPGLAATLAEGFVRPNPLDTTSTQSIRKLYDKIDETRTAYNTREALDTKTGAQSDKRRDRDADLWEDILVDAAEDMRDLREERKDIMENPDYSVERKRELLKINAREQTKTARGYLKEVNLEQRANNPGGGI